MAKTTITFRVNVDTATKFKDEKIINKNHHIKINAYLKKALIELINEYNQINNHKNESVDDYNVTLKYHKSKFDKDFSLEKPKTTKSKITSLYIDKNIKQQAKLAIKNSPQLSQFYHNISKFLQFVCDDYVYGHTKSQSNGINIPNPHIFKTDHIIQYVVTIDKENDMYVLTSPKTKYQIRDPNLMQAYQKLKNLINSDLSAHLQPIQYPTVHHIHLHDSDNIKTINLNLTDIWNINTTMVQPIAINLPQYLYHYANHNHINLDTLLTQALINYYPNHKNK